MESGTYRPAPAALEHLKQVNFVAVIGPTGAGKTRLIREGMQLNPSIHLVLNNTSRAPRPDEQEGVDYRFETRAGMEERIARGEYAQVAPSLFGDLYATAAEDYSTQGVAAMAVLADAMPAFRSLPFKSLRTVFVMPPDWQTWQDRLKHHGFHADKLKGRLREAERSLKFALQDNQLLFVVNQELNQAAKDFVILVTGQPLPSQLQADQNRAKIIAQDLLEQLQGLPRAV